MDLAHGTDCKRPERQQAIARSIANAIAVGDCVPNEALRARAREIAALAGGAGKVRAGGTWHEPAVHALVADALGAPSGPSVASRISSGTAAAARFFTTMRTTMRGSSVSGTSMARRWRSYFRGPRCDSPLHLQASSFLIRSKCMEFWRPACRTYAASDYQVCCGQRVHWIRVGYRPRDCRCLRHSQRRERYSDFKPHAHRTRPAVRSSRSTSSGAASGRRR